MTNIPSYPLYNRTYHLHRLSPLHHGHIPLLDQRALNAHATRLKGQLKGDNVRGVQVGAANTENTISQYGPLEECAWSLFGDEDAWIEHYQQLLDPDASQLSSEFAPEHARGVQVTLVYETQTYNALLLRDPASDSSPEGFTSLPLLLIRMPIPIREVFLNYLETNFDTHVSPLRLQSAFLTSTLESYIRHLTSATSTQSIRDIIQQLHIQLAFPNSTTLLKHIDVTIASPDVPGFVGRGKRIRDSKSAPFTAAVSNYLQKHMAISLSNPKVNVSKISCGAFTLSVDRVKLVPPETVSDLSSSEGYNEESASQLALQDFFSALVREARGSGKFFPDAIGRERTSSTPSSVNSASTSRGRRKRAVSSTAAGNTNTKRSRTRRKENGGGDGQDEHMDMSSS